MITRNPDPQVREFLVCHAMSRSQLMLPLFLRCHLFHSAAPSLLLCPHKVYCYIHPSKAAMADTPVMEDARTSRDKKDETSCGVSDEHCLDADSIDYEGLGDDSCRGDLGSSRPSIKEETLMQGKEISNTFRWKIVVILLIFVNTTLVVIGTTLYLNNEEKQELENMVRT
jgi:hypothetical protein